MFSNARRRILSKCNTWLRLLYLRSIKRKFDYVFMKLLGNHLTLCTGFSLLVGFLTEQRRILACFNGVFALMFCESISKIFNFSRTAEKKKKQLCEATTRPFLGGLPIARISCLIVRIYTRDEFSDAEFILKDDLPISDDLASWDR